METNDRVCDKNGGRREMETIITKTEGEEKWKLVTKNGGRREMETGDQKRRRKRNGNL